MADEATDVKPGEGETPTPSSSDTKPTDAGSPAGTETKPDEGAAKPPKGPKPGEGGDRTVPYSRFQSVVHELQKVKAERAAQSLVQGSPGEQPPKAPAEGDTSQFVTREELERGRRVDALTAEASDLMTKHDGSDGYPKFDLDEVTEFMKATGHTSYRSAYQELHMAAIIEAEKAKAVEAALNNNAPTTVASGGTAFGQPPKQGELSREGIAKMSLEEFKKMGGAKALKSKVLAGQLQ